MSNDTELCPVKSKRTEKHTTETEGRRRQPSQATDRIRSRPLIWLGGTKRCRIHAATRIMRFLSPKALIHSAHLVAVKSLNEGRPCRAAHLSVQGRVFDPLGNALSSLPCVPGDNEAILSIRDGFSDTTHVRGDDRNATAECFQNTQGLPLPA